MEEYQIKAIRKIANSEFILSIYPMIDNIKVSYSPDNNLLTFLIYLNTDDINGRNTYDKGLDTHYLVEYHIRKFFPYLGISDLVLSSAVVYNKSGKYVYHW